MAALLWARPGLALEPDRHPGNSLVRVWQATDGLAGDSVRSLAQTADGYLWLATQAGLSRFDGASFTRFDMQTVPDIRLPDARAVLARRDGALWVALSFQESLVHAGGAWTTLSRAGLLPAEDKRRVRAMHEDRRGVATIVADAGIFEIAGGRARPLPAPRIALDMTLAVLRDGGGRLWLAERRGLHLLRPAAGAFGAGPLPAELAKVHTGALSEDRQGRIWIGADDTLVSVAGEVAHVHAADRGPRVGRIAALLEDGQGHLWIGGAAGLARLRDGRFEAFHKADGLPEDDVTALFEDREGSLWVGTRQGGVAQIVGRTLSTTEPHASLATADIEGICEDADGALWFGTRGEGVYVWRDGRLDRYGAAQGLPSDYVTSVHPAREGGVWIGTLGGLARWHAGALETFTTPRRMVLTLFVDGGGTLWVGTTAGVARFEGGGLRPEPPTGGIGDENVRAFGEDGEGALWVSTLNRLYRRQQGRFVRQKMDDHVRSFLRDADGALWMTTDRAGLFRWRGGALDRFELRLDPDFPDPPYADALGLILDDDRGHLWLGARTGILRLPKASLAAGAASGSSGPRVVSFEAWLSG